MSDHRVGPGMRIAVALVGVAVGCGPAVLTAAAATTENAQLATWTPKELRFIYQGFTTRYSCDGLRDKVRSALLALGARQDLTVHETACATGSGKPDPFPGVTIKMQVLTPLTGSTTTPDAEAVGAHWKPVDLRLDRDAVADSGNCELLEQIKQSILPLFSTRNVVYNSTCVPHQLSTSGTRLRVEVLVSDAPEKKPSAAVGH